MSDNTFETVLRQNYNNQCKKIGVWEPLVFTFQDKEFKILARKVKINVDKLGVIHILKIKLGVLVKGLKPSPLTEIFKLNSKNELISVSCYSSTEQEIELWLASGFSL